MGGELAERCTKLDVHVVDLFTLPLYMVECLSEFREGGLD